MNNKKCFKCNTIKPLSEFYKHKAMGDGYLGKCKDCTKRDTKERLENLKENPEWTEKERIRCREKYINWKLNNPDKEKLRNSNHRKKYPEKYKARNKSQRIPCQKGNQLHHWSYNEEHHKDVIELSILDHALLHRNMIYDQERMMYRNINGILLDTKESHIELLNKLRQQN